MRLVEGVHPVTFLTEDIDRLAAFYNRLCGPRKPLDMTEEVYFEPGVWMRHDWAVRSSSLSGGWSLSRPAGHQPSPGVPKAASTGPRRQSARPYAEGGRATTPSSARGPILRTRDGVRAKDTSKRTRARS